MKNISGLLCASALALSSLLQGCADTPENRLMGGVIGATIVGGSTPTDDILQTYYLGVFDPTEQIPQTIYRVRVRGQASILSQTHFASGWVPASLIDTLSGPDVAKIAAGSRADSSGLFDTAYRNRRLVMFGPEGFREAPKDHRLVIVMGADPSAFFSAVDSTLGSVAQVQWDSDTSHLREALLERMASAAEQEKQLADLQAKFPATDTKK